MRAVDQAHYGTSTLQPFITLVWSFCDRNLRLLFVADWVTVFKQYSGMTLCDVSKMEVWGKKGRGSDLPQIRVLLFHV